MVASVNCAVAQVISGFDRARLTPGESVAIQGLGGLGLYATAFAKACGAHPIIAIDGIDDRLRLARNFGADHTIDIRASSTADTRVQEVQSYTRGLGADITLELENKASVDEINSAIYRACLGPLRGILQYAKTPSSVEIL